MHITNPAAGRRRCDRRHRWSVSRDHPVPANLSPGGLTVWSSGEV